MFRSFIIALSLFSVSAASGSEFKVTGLLTDNAPTPMGIDNPYPIFSWKMSDPNPGKHSYQKAYRIIVRDDVGNTVWDTGKVGKGGSINIPYQGKELSPRSRYHWTVNVWNKRGEQESASSWFETGIMSQDGWNGAQWISADDSDGSTISPFYLPVFCIDYNLKIEGDNDEASFIYGANDPRLLSANMNLFQVKNARGSSYIEIKLINSLPAAKLEVYRKGYHPDDAKSQPLATFNIASSRDSKGEYQINLTSVLGWTNIFVNDEKVGEININPVGRGGDYIAFPVLGDIGYKVPKGDKATFSNVNIRNFRTQDRILASVLKTDKEVSDTLIIDEIPPVGTTMLRSSFMLKGKPIAKARLYATARGAYDVYINGNRVNSEYLNPVFTEFNKTHMYQTYDITPLLHEGDNAIGAVLAEGWWSGGASFVGDNWNYYGDRQSLLSMISVTYSNGTTDIFVSNPAEWKSYNDGPLRYGSLFQGEIYDATKEKNIDGWTSPDYDDSKWLKAIEAYYPFGSAPVLTGQYGEGVMAVDTLAAQSMEEVRPGVFVYDMGQNFAGVPLVTLDNMPAGKLVNLRFAEVKYPDMPQYAGHEGMIMLENIRAAMAQDRYTTKGSSKETISPRFTYHGFRFIEITGIDKPLPLDCVKGIVLSSLQNTTAHYECSNPKVNKLWENMMWSARSNFFSIPTDCPQRNERMGWAGDISVFSRTALHISPVYQFLRRYLKSMRDTQLPTGRFMEVIPMSGGFGGLLWQSAGITVPWECYQMTGDTTVLAEHYGAMRRYIDYVKEHSIDKTTGIIVQERAWGDLCDWLGLEDGKNDKSLVWEAYWCYDLELMAKIAKILGKADDAEEFRRYREERVKLFNDTYIDPVTHKTRFSSFIAEKKGQPVDIQTSYALPLQFGLVDESHKKEFIANFRNTLTRSNVTDTGIECAPYSLMTGFIGTAWINQALSATGNSYDAYKLLTQEEYPSWIYPINQGATTVWERLNSYTHKDGFGSNNSMNSFNHYSFGAIGAWLINNSAGIVRDEECPGFQHFYLCPEADTSNSITHASGYFDSPYGRIESSWKKEGDTIIYNFTVPANTSATLILNGKKIKELTPGHHTVSTQDTP